MAEIAGLVVGGVALASLFDTCMNTLERLDAGRNCGEDYQEAALKVVLLGARLRRWEESYRTNAASGSPNDAVLIEAALKSINKSLETLANSSERYESQNGKAHVAALTDRLQNLTFGKKAKTGLGAKVVWALRDEKKFGKVIPSVRFKIEELEELNESLVPVRKELARKEAEELVHPSSIEEPETTLRVLNECAEEVDPEFREAAEAEAASKVAGHTYRNIYVGERARAQQGDVFTKGYEGPISDLKHSFDNVRTMGDARSHQGNLYGGKSVFDD